MTHYSLCYYSRPISEGDIAVVVQTLKDGFLFSGSRRRTSGSHRRIVVERIARSLGRKEFHVLNDNIYRSAFHALIVLVVPKLNTSADGNFVAFLV